jgi:hypothetical protein
MDFGAMKLQFWGAHHWLVIDSWTLQFKVQAQLFWGHVRIRNVSENGDYTIWIVSVHKSTSLPCRPAYHGK